MKKLKTKTAKNTDLKMKGFFRLNIVDPDGTVKGDTGWQENQIVNTGIQAFVQLLIAGSAGSLRASHAALGTGTNPASAATTLNGELTETAARCGLTVGTTGSTAVNYTFTLASGIVGGAGSTISNVGLFSGSTPGAGTMFAGKTYAASALASNQAVNGTYNITLST